MFKNYPIVFYSVMNTPEWAKILNHCIVTVADNKTYYYDPNKNESMIYGEV